MALKPMQLLCLLTQVVTTAWLEGEVWKVMKQLQDIYWPNDMHSIAEGKFKLGSVKMGADENPSMLLCNLTLKNMPMLSQRVN